MENFEFYSPTRIIFGKNQENRVGKEVKKYASKVMLVYGRNSIKASGLYDKVIDSLDSEKIKHVELSGVQGNPKLSLVYEGIKLAKKEEVEFVLAIGGGSVIDTAKAIALGAKSDKDVWDYYAKGEIVKSALRVGTILTVVGAGSEMSNSSVITNEENKLKRSVKTDLLTPTFSILNPELTYTVSPYQTACGSFDALSHLMERYFTKTKNVELTDHLIEAAMITIIDNAPIAIKDPTNYAARAELMWSATIAHNGLLNTGRVGDWACHAMEHELSGELDIPHGEGLAMITPSWMKYVYTEDVDRFVQFAQRVFKVEPQGSKEDIALKGIDSLKQFAAELGLKTDIKSLDLSDEALHALSKRALTLVPSIGHFKKLGEEDIYKIYKLSDNC